MDKAQKELLGTYLRKRGIAVNTRENARLTAEELVYGMDNPGVFDTYGIKKQTVTKWELARIMRNRPDLIPQLESLMDSLDGGSIIELLRENDDLRPQFRKYYHKIETKKIRDLLYYYPQEVVYFKDRVKEVDFSSLPGEKIEKVLEALPELKGQLADHKHFIIPMMMKNVNMVNSVSDKVISTLDRSDINTLGFHKMVMQKPEMFPIFRRVWRLFPESYFFSFLEKNMEYVKHLPKGERMKEYFDYGNCKEKKSFMYALLKSPGYIKYVYQFLDIYDRQDIFTTVTDEAIVKELLMLPGKITDDVGYYLIREFPQLEALISKRMDE